MEGDLHKILHHADMEIRQHRVLQDHPDMVAVLVHTVAAAIVQVVAEEAVVQAVAEEAVHALVAAVDIMEDKPIQVFFIFLPPLTLYFD
jgi:hypothetical protein